MDKMNGRYGFVMVLLLGAFVFGFSSFVGDMFSDDVRDGMNAVAYSPSSWSGSASGGGASSVGNMPILPMRSSKHSLFHHTAAVPAYTPVSHTSASGATPYYIYTPSHGAAASAGASAMSSADGFSLGGATEAHGVYLTSGAMVQSYGGAMTGYASSSASGSVASGYSASAGAVSSAAFAASSASASSSVSAYSFALNTHTATSPALMQSADQTLAARTAAPGRRKAKGATTIDDAWTNWLETEWAGGRNDLTLDELRALYDKMRAEDAQFAETYTWQDFLDWFGYRQQDDAFKWRLPIGDGVPVLLVLSLLWLLYKRFTSEKHLA